MKIEGVAHMDSLCRNDMEVVVLRIDAQRRCVPEQESGASK